MKNKKIDLVFKEFTRKLYIIFSHSSQKIRNLSGDNQQKVVIEKWLCIKPKILILDEPTRGIDVGAKAEIYKLITQIAKNSGIAVIFVSSEMPEIIGIADRIIVMCGGKIAGEYLKKEVNEEKLITSATSFR